MSAPETTLVTCPIFQTFEDTHLELYPGSFRMKRPFTGEAPEPPTRLGTEIQGFSKKSRIRLRFVADNCTAKIKTQFCMTYGDVWPINGRSLKADLNRFRTAVKKHYPLLEDLWIAEFQTRGCPHFHFFSNISLTPQNHATLTRIWHKIAGYGQDKHLRVHGHESNFIEWSMTNGNYLCKYLDKEHQKAIPEGFHNFGRWWGHSRNLVPKPTTVDLQAISEKFDRFNCDEYGVITDDRDAEKQLIRTLGRFHEKRLGKYRKRSFIRKTNRSFTVLGGRKIYDQLIEFWSKEDEHDFTGNDFSRPDNRPLPPKSKRAETSKIQGDCGSGVDSVPF